MRTIPPNLPSPRASGERDRVRGNMSDKHEQLPAELIAHEAHFFHGVERSAERAAELAREVGRLNDAVREAAGELGFDDQPGDFLALLLALREREETD